MTERVELWLSGPHETTPDWRVLPDMLHRLGLCPAAAPLVQFGSDPAQPIALSYHGLSMELCCGLSDDALARACDGAATVIGLPAVPSLSDHWYCALRADQPGRARPARTALAQRLCVIAALLAPVIGAEAMLWPPARLWSATAMLRDAVIAMEQSELPPVLHLVAFLQAPPYVADRHRMITRGLNWFAGHEMELNFPATIPAPAALRRIGRLAADAMSNGAIVGPMTVAGLERGELMRIGTAQNRSGDIIVPVELTV